MALYFAGNVSQNEKLKFWCIIKTKIVCLGWDWKNLVFSWVNSDRLYKFPSFPLLPPLHQPTPGCKERLWNRWWPRLSHLPTCWPILAHLGRTLQYLWHIRALHEDMDGWSWRTQPHPRMPRWPPIAECGWHQPWPTESSWLQARRCHQLAVWATLHDMVSLCLCQCSAVENLTNVRDLVLGGDGKGVSYPSEGRNGWSDTKATVWGKLQSKHAGLPPHELSTPNVDTEFYFYVGVKDREAGMALPQKQGFSPASPVVFGPQLSFGICTPFLRRLSPFFVLHLILYLISHFCLFLNSHFCLPCIFFLPFRLLPSKQSLISTLLHSHAKSVFLTLLLGHFRPIMVLKIELFRRRMSYIARHPPDCTVHTGRIWSTFYAFWGRIILL